MLQVFPRFFAKEEITQQFVEILSLLCMYIGNVGLENPLLVSIQ